MKKTALCAIALLLLSPAAAIAAAPLPAPKIVVLDKSAILSVSKVGQDVTRQLNALQKQAEADLNGQAKALAAQEQALNQQIAVLSADAKQKKIQEFQNKEAALNAVKDRKQLALQYTALMANQAIAKKLDPILQQLMQQRGANLILDRAAVLKGSDSAAFDITGDAINRLNQQMPSYKVTLLNPPAGAGR